MKIVIGLVSLMIGASVQAAPLDYQRLNLDAKVRSQLPAVSPAQESTSEENIESDNLDQAVVHAFVRNDCKRILELVRPGDYTKVNGRVLAVVAACAPPGKDQDKMFKRARELSPNDDSILLLHARFRSQKEMVSATRLWTLLESRTKDERVREMARLYIEGRGSEAEEVYIERKSTLSGFIQAGSVFESNPSLVSNSDRNSIGLKSSVGATVSGLVRTSQQRSYGSLGFDYYFSETSYFQAHDADLFAHEFGVPITLNATNEATIMLRPYLTHALLGNRAYLSDLGVSITRADTFSGFNQAVSVSCYYEHYFQDEDQPLQGTHVKVEYMIRPKISEWVDADFAIFTDHSSAGRDTSTQGLSIPYSNFTTGAVMNVSSKAKTSVGLHLAVSYRGDDEASSFVSAATSQTTSETRADFSYQIQPFVSYTFGERSNWQAIGAYQYSSVNSNIDENDYIDRNSIDQSVTISIRRIIGD